MNILAVDNDAGFLQSLEIGLHSHGHRIILASSMAQALEKLAWMSAAGIRPHLLMAALQMPEMNGVSLIYKAREILPELPCILMISASGFRLSQKIARVPACGRLNKPFTPLQLLREIEKVYA